jgi:hypothetical protein
MAPGLRAGGKAHWAQSQRAKAGQERTLRPWKINPSPFPENSCDLSLSGDRHVAVVAPLVTGKQCLPH